MRKNASCDTDALNGGQLRRENESVIAERGGKAAIGWSLDRVSYALGGLGKVGFSGTWKCLANFFAPQQKCVSVRREWPTRLKER